MKLAWVIEGHGAGSADVATVDDAGRCLAAALRDVYGRADTDTLARILVSVLAPLRAQLVTDGRAAVARGEEWSTQRAGLLVTLVP